MQILLIDDRVPDPQFGAGFPRAYRLLLSLYELGHTIHFIPTTKSNIQEIDPEILRNFNTQVYDTLQHVPTNIDVVIIARPHNMHYQLPLVSSYLPDAKIIYDTEALWYRRYDLQLKITGVLPGWAYRYDEIGLAKQADLCFCVNNIEKKIMEENGVLKVVKLAHAIEPIKNGEKFEKRKNILVVGGKLEKDSSNEDGLWWYLENCWEKIYEKLNCELNVTGMVSSERLKNSKFPKVNLLGHVDDLTKLYKTHKAFVAATRFSTGIPWKVHEAMANGIPCLISQLLADQLELIDDSYAMVCKNEQEFINKTIKLYNEKNVFENIRNKAFNLIERDCSIDGFKSILQSNLVELVKTN